MTVPAIFETRRRERLGHIRTTADLISHLEAILVRHLGQGQTPTPIEITTTLLHTIDHLWSLPNVDTTPGSTELARVAP